MSYDELSRDQVAEALKEIEQKLEKIEEERDKYERLAKKAKADFENYKKKQDERRKKWRREAQKELAEDLIAVIDNFERALAMAEKDSSIYKGVKMTADQLFEALEKRGLERINAEGEEFDPRIHNAVETREHDEDQKVLEQKKPGYRFKDRIIREAEVVVGENQN